MTNSFKTLIENTDECETATPTSNKIRNLKLREFQVFNTIQIEPGSDYVTSG